MIDSEMLKVFPHFGCYCSIFTNICQIQRIYALFRFAQARSIKQHPQRETINLRCVLWVPLNICPSGGQLPRRCDIKKTLNFLKETVLVIRLVGIDPNGFVGCLIKMEVDIRGASGFTNSVEDNIGTFFSNRLRRCEESFVRHLSIWSYCTIFRR